MLSRFEQFSGMISGIYRYIQKLERDEMEKQGYKGSFAQYLVTIHHYEDGITSAQLCEICDKDKAAVSRVVNEMETMGLVTRANEGRYRAKIRLTEKGQEAAQFVSSRARVAVNTVGSVLTDAERRSLYEILERVSGRIQVLTREGIPQEPDI